MSLKFISICSGIEAASVAWEPLGWTPLAFSEIEPFPCAVLKHHYPHVPNFGDMTKFDEWPEDVLAECDVLVGGCPCQAFSVAGLRQSLADARGNLTLVFVKLINHIDAIRSKHGRPPIIIVYENVPGILSTGDNAFGNFLGALSGEDGPLEPPGGKWTNAGLVCGPARDLAWRVLDAQYFGVAQRRRRVFLVGHSRAGALRPVKVLLVEQGMQRHSPPSREAGQRVAPTLAARTRGGGGLGTDFDLDGGLIRHDGGRGGVAYGFQPRISRNGRGDMGDLINALNAQSGETGKGDAAPCVAHVVAPPRKEGPWTFRADAMREGTAKTPSADAEGRIRLRDPGMGMYEGIAPTLDCGQPHGVAHVVAPPRAVAFTTRGRDGGLSVESQDELAYALKNPGAGGRSNDRMVAHVVAPPQTEYPEVAEVCGTISDGAHNGGGLNGQDAYTGRVLPVVPYDLFQITAPINRQNRDENSPCHTLARDNAAHAAVVSARPVAFAQNTRDEVRLMNGDGSIVGALSAESGMHQTCYVAAPAMAVRRLTPVECERLQGFPDNYTRIPWKKKPAEECPDGPRYKALGNSMAVPCMYWIGWQIRKAMT